MVTSSNICHIYILNVFCVDTADIMLDGFYFISITSSVTMVIDIVGSVCLPGLAVDMTFVFLICAFNTDVLLITS